MGKKGFFVSVAFIATLLMVSCGQYKEKSVNLKSQNDSLNYTLGLANGAGVKDYFLKTDSSEKTILVIMKALDEAYKSGDSKDEMYKMGYQIGVSLKQMKVKGLLGDSTLVFDEKIVKQAMINGLKGYDKGMTAAQAQNFLQQTMMKIQQQRMLMRAKTMAAPNAPGGGSSAPIDTTTTK
jgi:Domain amino terminal to FKBP-type peptidyl-prolyl isomerase